MKWTRNTPIETGFYFVKWYRGKRRVVEICVSKDWNYKVKGYGVNCDIKNFKYADTYWAGPIEEPEEDAEYEENK